MTAWDEMVTGRGGVRPHWRSVLGTTAGLDACGLADRAARLARVAEQEGSGPSWRCDPMPFPLPAQEFAALEAGLEQRARLIEAVLADMYGPQLALAEGWLAPALVHANPGFLRECREGPAPPRFLHAYAADLVRGPDGQWRVLADRTGGAHGIATARETRRLLARVVPELFRGNPVRSLRPFFDMWQDALIRTAPFVGDRPTTVALLTLGAADPHWAEHTALSRYLGCALVEARDLVVRDGKLLLRDLRRTQQIDVLLRRVPGHRLDPLENLDGSPAGIAGLLEAARQGTVRILNHPGAAAIEAPALAAFMPSLCRRLLGEPLRLATLPSLWLADDGAKRMVAGAFRRWAIRPAFDGAAAPVPLAELSTADRVALEHAIEAEPWNHVGCTVVPPSISPWHGPDGLLAEPTVLRMFLVHDGASWRTMPGGIARALAPGAHAGEAFPAHGAFKDVWVLSDEDHDISGREAPPQPRVALRRNDGDLPARAADDFYWLGRHVERLDAQARLARAGLVRRARSGPLPREWAELEVLSLCLDRVGISGAGTGVALDAALSTALGPGGAIADGLTAIAQLVTTLRDRLTVETYSAFQHALRATRHEAGEGAQIGLDGLVHAMTGLQHLATAVTGLCADGMVRGGGRLFLELGKRVERAMVTTGGLRAVLSQPPARMESALHLSLELCDSALAYRSRYNLALQPGPVLDLVLADDGNPRALAYQFAEAVRLLKEAGAADLASSAQTLRARASSLCQRVLDSADPCRAASELPAPLLELQRDSAALCDGIGSWIAPVTQAVRVVGLEVG